MTCTGKINVARSTTSTPLALSSRHGGTRQPLRFPGVIQRQHSVLPKAVVDGPSKTTGSKSSTATQFKTVVLEPSYNLQAGLLAIAGVEASQGWYPIAAFTALLGALLIVQASRVKFVFDDEALEVKINGQESDNVVVGGRNRWPYSSFMNWKLFFPPFPVLVYYKENQTKPEGQIHFFPIIFNGKQLYDVMKERCGPSV